jgi:ribosomal protein S18 acetylase RimI-like enzyme
MRRLLVHEARVHAQPGRALRDLGDAILLTDPADPEPFWNRLEGLRWPSEPDAFDRRLTEALVQFAALGRQAHIWASPLHDTPADLVARLEVNGFRDRGSGNVMTLADPSLAERTIAAPQTPGVALERHGRVEPSGARPISGAVVDVLLDAFDVDLGRRPTLEAETADALADPRFTYYLARIDGTPAAVARCATFDGCSYLSSIGTAGWARGRGLGQLVTCAAAIDSVAADSDWTYLGVFADNDVAIGVYERSGFKRIGEPAADMLLE